MDRQLWGVGNAGLIKPWASVPGVSFQAVDRLLQWREYGRRRPRGNLMDKLLCFSSSSCLYHIKKKRKESLRERDLQEETTGNSWLG